MKLTKKLNIATVLVVLCLILVIAVSYAWLTIAMRPEVQRLETNVGANGSLEIALLSEETFVDPGQIRTLVGDSAVKLEVTESNKSWGNVILLGDGYGLEEIVLLPARLNLTKDEDGAAYVNGSLLKTAEFGRDGRIKSLSEDTVSTTWEESWDKGEFVYYASGRRYGVRAIGTLSNMSEEQITLSEARTLVPAYTAAAIRSAKNTWQEQGAGIVDILYRYYALEQDTFTREDAQTVQGFAAGILEASEYVLDAMEQTAMGLAAANVSQDQEFQNALLKAEKMYADAQDALANSYALTYQCTWESIEGILSLLMSPDKTYLGSSPLSDKACFEQLEVNNTLLLSPDAGVLGQIADFTGNFSAYAVWRENINLELMTASTEDEGFLVGMQKTLQSVEAANGSWTRTTLDDTYGFAIDMAFRCNAPSELLLQTQAAMRVPDDSEFAVTQGSGSFMQFHSDNMDSEQLINLMNTIRVGFLSDKGELLSVAKLDLSKSIEEEGEISAPLYLWDYEVNDNGSIRILKRSENAVIRELPQNSPTVITVVVWMDGDSVDNSMVGQVSQQSMSGILNLQFSSSADLVPSKQLIDRN